MSEILAQYSFLPWVRQGLGTQITETDLLGNPPGNNAVLERPQVEISAKVRATKGDETKDEPFSKPVKIQGPGDVLGINHKSIIRVHPKKGVNNFETNNLCYIEFYEEDLPWRFTPAKPSGGKLRPWLALIVLKEDEFDKSTSGTTPTPFITLANQQTLSKVFTNQKDTCALAHVHVLEDLDNNDAAGSLQEKLNKNPDLALSRIICPRKFEYTENESNEYFAFLVPAYETGRLAGMGLDTSETPAQMSSWRKSEFNSGSHPLSYPYYYTWSFKVDNNGDFETLAELLQARELPENIGKREMDLNDMGFGIKPDTENVIGYVEGSMRHPDYITAPWPVNNSTLRNELLEVLNLSADLQDTEPYQQTEGVFYWPKVDEDPIIAPPTYGKWHGGVYRMSPIKSDWVHELNMHPTNRAAAGLGTQVVQKNQEKFMEMAWEQIGQINEANQKIIENELAKRLANSLVQKKLNKFGEFDLLHATGATQNVVKYDNSSTASSKLVNSRVPTALRSGAFLKVANNFTPTALMAPDGQDGAVKVLQTELLQRLDLNEGEQNQISAAPKRAEIGNAMEVQNALAAITAVVDNQPLTFMQHLAQAIKPLGTGFETAPALANLPNDFTTEQIERATAILDAKEDTQLATVEGVEYLDVFIDSDVYDDRISTSFDEGVYEEVRFKRFGQVEPLYFFDQSQIIAQRLEFKNTFASFLMPEINGSPTVQVFERIQPQPLQLDFGLQVLHKLKPTLTFSRQLAALFATTDPAALRKPIMAYPRFPIPVYDYLKEISPDYIIPNVSEIEPNTITLMEPNKKFIESFMVGMNHEFSRELLWREFPTDMRGSYFRHFWEYDNDPSAEIKSHETVEEYVERVVYDQDAKADIHELHTWHNGTSLSNLGDNHNRGPSLVLLIKGEIFKKYPNTLVYAQHAKFKTNKLLSRELDTYEPENPEKVKWPIITGKLEPDVYFFGFDGLTKEQANGNRTSEPGWFFALRERPGQISFGLDDLPPNTSLDSTPPSWDEVHWENITGNAATQPKFLKITGTTINLDANGTGPRDANWGGNSADMAYILYQSPVIFARHASTMLTD